MVQNKPGLKKSQQKKRKLQHASPTKKKAKVVHQVTVSDSSEDEIAEGSEHPDIDSHEVPNVYDFGNSKFDLPFDLTGISEALQERMLAAAPVLRGREAEYDDAFFRDKVGLCDQGPLVDDISKVYTNILEADIKQIWKAGAQPNRYEIANCTDKEQARIFSQHNYRVYGHRPDNAYFAMRFLKAAFATFVHGKDVNWVAEAQGRRTKRLASATKNPRKLGPVALRRQLEGLCEIMGNLATGTPARRRIPRSLQAAEKEVDSAKAAETAAVNALELLQKQYAEAMEVVAAYTDEEYAAREAENTAASVELRRVFREGTPSEYKAQFEVLRALSEKFASMQEEQMRARSTIRDLDAGPLAEAGATRAQASAHLAAAEASLKKTKQDNLILRSHPVFAYPSGHSVPIIDSCGSEVCSFCCQRFRAKAAILGSCGCLFHNVCVAEMIDSDDCVCRKCSFCNLDPAWVAQWDGKLDDKAEAEVEATVKKFKKSKSTAAQQESCEKLEPKGIKFDLDLEGLLQSESDDIESSAAVNAASQAAVLKADGIQRDVGIQSQSVKALPPPMLQIPVEVCVCEDTE